MESKIKAGDRVYVEYSTIGGQRMKDLGTVEYVDECSTAHVPASEGPFFGITTDLNDEYEIGIGNDDVRIYLAK